jgi:transposase IS4-like protein
VPRAGWVKPATDQRLSDHISIGVLTRVFPPELVDRVVAQTGRGEQRQRLLPARVVVYYVLGLALYSSSSYEEVIRMLVDGLSWASGWRTPWSVPTKGALAQAHSRLGPEPLRGLFEQVAVPLATPATPGACYRELRLVSIDGTCIDVADSPANEARFGRPGSGRGQGVGGFPQLRLVALAECGTHAITRVALGPYTTGELALADQLWSSLDAGMLCLADRNFYSFERFQKARQTEERAVACVAAGGRPWGGAPARRPPVAWNRRGRGSPAASTRSSHQQSSRLARTSSDPRGILG